MSLAAGSLNQRIEIHRRVTTQDPVTGVVTEDFALFAEAWANVRPLSGREFVAAGAQQSKVVATVKIRYIAGVEASMRIRHGSRIYNIEEVLEDHMSGREWLTLPVTEIRGEESE